MLTKSQKKEFKILAEKIRLETLKSIVNYGRGHVGGSVSMADTLAVLYGGVMKIDPQNPQMKDRDRFVLSKGHSGPGLYAALALAGFFPLETLDTMNAEKTILPSHCDMNKTPGVDMCSGSLGLGLSVALGMALACRFQRKDYYIYAMVGDGELDEGQIWEAVMMAAHQKADHLIMFVDCNKMQLDGPTENICMLGNLSDKFNDFGWFTQEIDGHDVESIYQAIIMAKESSGKPCVIILNTVKGYGCPNALSLPTCHAVRYITEEAKAAGEEDIKYLENKIAELSSGDGGVV